MTPEEVQALLSELAAYLAEDIANLWSSAASLASDGFRAVVIDAFPELVFPYAAAASTIGAQWYDLAPSTNDRYQVVEADLPPVERFTSSAEWALNTGDSQTGLALLQGSGERGVFDAARNTVLENVESEVGASWARHASANACPFCRMNAIRGDVYRSRETASFKAHDNCHCLAVMVRPGAQFEPAPYIQEWEQQYFKARDDADSGDTNAILNAWARALRD